MIPLVAEPKLNPYFQVGLDVLDKRCLVIGGGREAENKTGRLREAGARLAVVSPTLTDQLQSWCDEGQLTHRRGEFRSDDIDGAFLIVNTVRDPELAFEVFGLACEARSLISSFDMPHLSNVGMAALVNPGHLRVSISTSNASPSLARRLREDLEGLFDDEFIDFLDALGRVRVHLKEHMTDSGARIDILRSLVADFRLTGRIDYPANWQADIKALTSETSLPE